MGWFLLFITNLVLFNKGRVTDTFAIISKLILLVGIIDHDFIIMVEKVRREFSPHFPPPDTGWKKEGTLNLVISPRNSLHSSKIKWIKRKVQENVNRGHDTHIFVFQDVVPHGELREIKWISPERVFIFLFSESAKKARKEFVVLPLGITRIGATVSEVIKRYEKSERGCTLIFLDLSLLIHWYGAHPVYKMLLNKMGSLREEGIELFAFVNPETHSEKSVVSLFKSISDNIIQL